MVEDIYIPIEWFKLSEVALIGPKLVKESIEKV